MSREQFNTFEQVVRHEATIEELVGIPKQDIIVGKDIYIALARRPLKISRYGNSLVVHFPKIVGEELAALRYFAAPSKIYSDDFDFEDTLMDWNELFTDTSSSTINRLRSHRHIPGWSHFEHHWKQILNVMDEGMARWLKKEKPTSKSASIMPAALFLKEGDQWIWDTELGKSVHGLHDLSWLSTLYVAGYSPEITKTWGPRSNYSGRASTGYDGTQDMGPTQAIPLALGKRNSLMDSNLVRKIITLSNEKTGV